MTIPQTSAQVPLVAPRALDRTVVVELMANARDNIHRDFGRGSVFTVVAALVAGAVAGDVQVGLVAGAVVVWPTVYIALRSAITRRRLRCAELGVDPDEVDRLFKGVDLFQHVVGWNRLADDVRAQLVEDIVAGRYVRRRELWGDEP